MKDLQFYREASEAAFDETGNRKRRRQQNGGDEDEIDAEQEERKKRAELNRHFKLFADKIADASDGRLEVDIPFRELGFQGVPFRSSVLLQPTTDCLVHLVEPPFLVVPLVDVEVAHLERIQYGLKNFDLVFVFRDFTKAPVHMYVTRALYPMLIRDRTKNVHFLGGQPVVTRFLVGSWRTSKSGSTRVIFLSQRGL